MNVCSGGRSFRIELHETSSFYFCNHFLKAFKDKINLRNTTILRQLKELIAYCSECKEIIDKYLKHLDSSSIEFFSEARKLLIQYYPINQTYKNFYWYINLG